MKNLYHDERSTVTVGFLFLMVPLYLCIAAIWNTGSLVDQKMRAQAIADAAALSAASQMSHSINQMIMLNMLALRAQSAQATALRCMVTAAMGGALALTNAVLSAIPPPNPFFDLAEVPIATLDSTFLFAWLAKIGKTMSSGDYKAVTDLDINDQQKKVNEKLLKRMHQQISDIDDAVNSKLKKPGGVGDALDDARDIYNWKRHETYKIYVAHKDADIYYPESQASDEKIIFEKTETYQRFLALMIRNYLADGQWANASKFKTAVDFANDKNLEEPNASWLIPSLRPPKFFDALKSKKPVPIYPAVLGIWYVLNLANVGIFSASQWGYLFDETDRDLLQVAVIVEKSDDIPYIGDNIPDIIDRSNYSFMATGFFKSVNERKVIAMAQAETYNTYYHLIKNLAVLGDVLADVLNDTGFFRWMQWASLGANYQARLTRIDSKWLGEVKADKFKNYLEDTLKLKSGDADVFLH